MHSRFLFPIALITTLASPLRAGVVINEIFFHAPNDLNDLEYIELFNDSPDTADLGGWKFSNGIQYEFPNGTTMQPGAYLVLCKDRTWFAKFYQHTPAGEFSKSLQDSGEKVTLKNTAGKAVESVEYNDRPPWPQSADGHTASLERICPSAPAKQASNWAPSALSANDDSKPAGTPGSRNGNYMATLPPVITGVHFTPEICQPGDVVTVTANVEGEPTRVELLYRIAQPGSESNETSVGMERAAGGDYAATIPGSEANRILRFRIRATGSGGATRIYPHPNELRPAFSVYVAPVLETGSKPLLANPIFREKFRSRLKVLASTVFTEESFGPHIDRLEASLEPEILLRASLVKRNPGVVVDRFHQTMNSLREHIKQRHAFVLAELEKE